MGAWLQTGLTAPGKVRRVVERVIAWLHRFMCLHIRYERGAGLHQSLLDLA
ncbi:MULTISPECIES: hypothetical protein [unclassified Streptomyces]|jgi:hypothetical protein|uniref:hypothetical protein n=1 Tax=unclassified Streptomyces TaxID=2593676 RepID=UPI00136E4206|nr:hypothetical protein [Streptomyces sp. SID4936]